MRAKYSALSWYAGLPLEDKMEVDIQVVELMDQMSEHDAIEFIYEEECEL